jgi:hypothetical protein
MKATSADVAGRELGREETRRGLQDLTGQPQLRVLPLQRLELLRLPLGRAQPLTGIDLILARTHLRNVSVDPMPSFTATAFIAAHSVA